MCHAFQEIGIDTTLMVPESNECSENNCADFVELKIGRKPLFKIKFYTRYTIAGKGTALGAYLGINLILKSDRDFDYCYVRSVFLNRMALTHGFKVIYESHGSVLHPGSKLLNWVYCRKLLRDTHSANQILFVAISQALADVWRKRGVPEKKILVLHDGVSVEDYDCVLSQESMRKHLCIDSKRKLVVYTGSLYKDRGIENILKLAKIFPDANFYVVGGPEREKCYYESIAKQGRLMNVIFVGLVPHRQVKDYLFAADVLLMLWSVHVPTINVCSPLKVFEYMAAGRIIVGQGFPTIKEVLKDGDTAILTEPDSYEDLERKLRYALSLDYPNAMAQKARDLSLNSYSWTKRSKSILEALDFSREL